MAQLERFRFFDHNDEWHGIGWRWGKQLQVLLIPRDDLSILGHVRYYKKKKSF